MRCFSRVRLDSKDAGLESKTLFENTVLFVFFFFVTALVTKLIVMVAEQPQHSSVCLAGLPVPKVLLHLIFRPDIYTIIKTEIFLVLDPCRGIFLVEHFQ